jgi:hypothetical protein
MPFGNPSRAYRQSYQHQANRTGAVLREPHSFVREEYYEGSGCLFAVYACVRCTCGYHQYEVASSRRVGINEDYKSIREVI